MKPKIWKLLSLVFIAIFAASAVNTVHAAATQLATPPSIPVAYNADCLAYDSGKGEIFVSSGYGYSGIAVISDSTNTVVATITTITSPAAMAYDSGKGEIFVISIGSISTSGFGGQLTPSTVVVISDSTNDVVANITVGNTGDLSEGIAYDSAKGEIFVANSDDNTVSVISDSTNTVIATINVGNNPTDLAYDSGKGEIFVSNEASSSVSVISDSTNQVVATINGSASAGVPGAWGVAYDSAKGEVFVADYPAAAFSVISDKNNNVVTEVDLETAGATVGLANEYNMGFDTGTGQVFLNSDGSSVNIISDKNNAVVAYFPGADVAGGVPVFGFAYDSGKGAMFIGGGSNDVVYYLSDSSRSSASSTSSSSSTSSPSPTPTIPEFSSAALIIVVAAMVVAVVCIVVLTVKKKQLRN